MKIEINGANRGGIKIVVLVSVRLLKGDWNQNQGKGDQYHNKGKGKGNGDWNKGNGDWNKGNGDWNQNTNWNATANRSWSNEVLGHRS